MIELNYDVLLARNKLLSIKLETISNKLDARELAQLSSNDLVCEKEYTDWKYRDWKTRSQSRWQPHPRSSLR